MIAFQLATAVPRHQEDDLTSGRISAYLEITGFTHFIRKAMAVVFCFYGSQALCAMHKLPSRMLEQLLHPQAQRSAVADSAALHRSGLSLRLREALHAAFNNSQAWPCCLSTSGILSCSFTQHLQPTR